MKNLGKYRKSLGKSRKNLRKSRKNIRKSRRNIRKSRKNIGKYRKSLGKSRKNIGKTYALLAYVQHFPSNMSLHLHPCPNASMSQDHQRQLVHYRSAEWFATYAVGLFSTKKYQ